MRYIIIIILFFVFLIQNISLAVEITDYSDKSNWLAISEKNEYSADVFYIYPTVCTTERTDNICGVDDKQMRLTARGVYKLQAEAFAPIANIYAPFYTQYNFKAFANSNYLKIQQDIHNNVRGISDIYNALDYYFKNYNNNKPFILVSHSQGSGMMLLVLSDYMKKHPDYYKNMVAAYVIGYPVTKDYMKANPHLKFAKKHNDTGVIISYDVKSHQKTGVDIFKVKDKLVINPISWTRKAKIATANENLGSLDEKTLNIISPGIADAKVDKKSGDIICSTVNVELYEIKLPELFGRGSFHGQDFQFYFLNLRQNAKERIDKFLYSK